MAVQKQDGFHTDSAVSAADLRGKEMFFCKKDGSGSLVLAGAADYVEGVISEGKNVSYHTSYNTAGNEILRVVAGSALARGDLVSSDAQGRAVVGTANIFGKVRNPVSAAGVIAEIIPGRVLDSVDNT